MYVDLLKNILDRSNMHAISQSIQAN